MCYSKIVICSSTYVSKLFYDLSDILYIIFLFKFTERWKLYLFAWNSYFLLNKRFVFNVEMREFTNKLIRFRSKPYIVPVTKKKQYHVLCVTWLTFAAICFCTFIALETFHYYVCHFLENRAWFKPSVETKFGQETANHASYNNHQSCISSRNGRGFRDIQKSSLPSLANIIFLSKLVNGENGDFSNYKIKFQ